MARRPNDRAAARAGRAATAEAGARALRRGDRRLPGPLRPAGCKAYGAGCAGRLQPTRLARGHARLGSRALPGRIAPGTCTRARRPLRATRRRRRRRGHRAARAFPRESRGARPCGGVLRGRRGADLPARRAERCVHACALRRQADPAPGRRDDPRGSATRAGHPVSRRRKRAARRVAGAASRQRRMGALGRVRAAGRRASRGRRGTRDLRALGQGGAGDPEQGVPGAGLWHAADLRRHAGGARTARRRRERASRPTRRRACARDRAAPARLRRRASRADRPRRTRGVPSAGKRTGARPALARNPRTRQVSRSLGLAVASFAAGFGALAVLRHRSFETGRFDLGNMTQAVWSTAHGDPLAVTNLAGEQTTRLASHFDPILVLLAPLWLVWPSPETLLVAQAVAIALGALPVFWLARKHLDSERAALGFALAYLLYPATQWVALSEFHPVALACPLLPFAICAALACATKEEIPLAVAGLGVWYALARRRRVAGITIAVAETATAALALGVVAHYNEGGDPFAARYEEVGGSPTGILKTLVTDPLTIARAVFDREGSAYLLALFVPLAFLPLAAPLALLPALPDLALNLLSSTDTQASIHFH